jgi:5'(3')-deoxyribonucleotidase
MKPTIALDFDSTIADTKLVAYKLMLGDDHERDPHEATHWDDPIDRFGAERFLSAMWHSWTLRPMDVPVTEPGLPEVVSSLREHYEVDIVTAQADHMGISEGKKKWLAEKGIDYDNFATVAPTTTKAQMGYDIYIDDKPLLPERVNNQRGSSKCYLIDWPYNQDADGDYIRVDTVAEAAHRLLTYKTPA